MALNKPLVAEFDHEMANTRKALERIPDEKLDWKPHEKSMPLGGLATHLANIPTWAVTTIEKESFDMAPPGEPPPRMAMVRSRKEVLDLFDKNVSAARAAIAGANDEHLKQRWSLLAGGKTVFTLPRIAVLRSLVLNHGIHHRGQLTVYLRLNNIPVPALYGPSADEQP